jgi:transcriptional regulator with XRE-family HTH domain
MPRIEDVAVNLNIKIARKLRDLRVSQGLTQDELAKAIGVSIQQVQKYEKAVNRISSARLVLAVKLLKVSMANFFEGIEDEKFNVKEPTFSKKQQMCMDIMRINKAEHQEILTDIVKRFADKEYSKKAS